MHNAEIVRAWKKMSTKPFKGPDGIVMSVYEANVSGGPPSFKKALQSLSKKVDDLATGGGTHEDQVWLIHAGLLLEERQKVLQSKKASSGKEEDVIPGRAKLGKDIVIWRKKQLSLFPSLYPEIKSLTDETAPETTPLFLPSSFSQTRRNSTGLGEAASIEYQLREGLAHDALQDVRTTIKTINANLQFKKNNVSGQRPNTRAQQHLKTLLADRNDAVDRYHHAYSTLVELGMSETDQALRPLTPEDVWCKDASSSRKMGDSRKEDPWFWHTGRCGVKMHLHPGRWVIRGKRIPGSGILVVHIQPTKGGYLGCYLNTIQVQLVICGALGLEPDKVWYLCHSNEGEETAQHYQTER
ncbi:hypothetical protein H0H93_009028 [Arthromyces matolae]|nr:hypothetical protein H0H93_009028 [Arthromyces matolae]